MCLCDILAKVGAFCALNESKILSYFISLVYTGVELFVFLGKLFDCKNGIWSKVPIPIPVPIFVLQKKKRHYVAGQTVLGH